MTTSRQVVANTKTKRTHGQKAAHGVPAASPGKKGPVASLLQLQNAVGNQAVTRLLQRQGVVPLPIKSMPAGQVAREVADPPTIRSRSEGPFVEEAQQHLNAHGASPALKVDGKFGSKTKAAVRAFQSGKEDKDGKPLSADGVIGPLTWGTLRKSASKSTAPETKVSKEKLGQILAKGVAMSPEEAAEAKKSLFQLEGDEFKGVIKEAVASGAFMAMLSKLPLKEILDIVANLTQEVVIPTTLLKPAVNTIDDDFKRANEIYNPRGIEIEKGNKIELSEKATKKLLGHDLKMTEFTTKKATSDELKLIEMNRQEERMAGYWVPDFHNPTRPGGGSRGEGLMKEHLDNLGDGRQSVVINTSNRAQDTFAHEVGHVLGLDHATGQPLNLMAPGTERKITGAGIDQLTDAQLAILRSSIFTELGRKGVGK